MPFYTPENILKYNAHINIILGPRCCGKTWGISHYIMRDGHIAVNKTAIITRTRNEIKFMNGSTPFGWDDRLYKKGSRVICRNEHGDDFAVGRYFPLSSVHCNSMGNVLFCDLNVSEYDTYKYVIFDDVNSPWQQPFDFNRFLFLCSNVVKISDYGTIFVMMNYARSDCDITAGLGFSTQMIDMIEPGEIMVRERKGLVVAFEKIKDERMGIFHE